MANLNADQIAMGPVAVYVGTAGLEPTNNLGYTTDKGIEFDAKVTSLTLKTGNTLGAIGKRISDASVTMTGGFQQVTLDLLYYMLSGVTRESATLLDFDLASAPIQKFSVKAIGINENGLPRTGKMLNAMPSDDYKHALAAGTLQEAPFTFEGIAVPGTKLYSIEDDETTAHATLASGVLTRVAAQVYHVMLGEGGAADALTSITGASLVDGELLILKIYATTQAITVTSATAGTGHIELTSGGTTTWLMNHLEDVLWLQYVAATTKWIEISRFDSLA
jgi:hypothetical protein